MTQVKLVVVGAIRPNGHYLHLHTFATNKEATNRHKPGQWEYKTVQGTDVRSLHILGPENWELVTIWSATDGKAWSVFKRPK